MGKEKNIYYIYLLLVTWYICSAVLKYSYISPFCEKKGDNSVDSGIQAYVTMYDHRFKHIVNYRSLCFISHLGSNGL